VATRFFLVPSPPKKIEIHFCKGKLGGHLIFMFFKEKEIRWPPNFHVLLGKGELDGHLILIFFRKRKIEKPPDFFNYRKKNLNFCL
jgi:hypothetical protein